MTLFLRQLGQRKTTNVLKRGIMNKVDKLGNVTIFISYIALGVQIIPLCLSNKPNSFILLYSESTESYADCKKLDPSLLLNPKLQWWRDYYNNLLLSKNINVE